LRPRLTERAERLRAPLLLVLWILLGFEAASGLVLFAAFLIAGRRPGEAIHVVAGVPLTAIYACYQWGHWRRVAPFRGRPDHVLGLVAALVTSLTVISGLWLGAEWWVARIASSHPGAIAYPPLLSAVHNIGSMLVIAFVGAHLGAVLWRESPRLSAGSRRGPGSSG
jgi:hypothetical protein